MVKLEQDMQSAITYQERHKIYCFIYLSIYVYIWIKIWWWFESREREQHEKGWKEEKKGENYFTYKQKLLQYVYKYKIIQKIIIV